MQNDAQHHHLQKWRVNPEKTVNIPEVKQNDTKQSMMHLIFGLKDEFFGCCTRLALCSVLAAEMTLARAPAETSLQKWTSGYDGEILRDGHAAAREGDDVE